MPDDSVEEREEDARTGDVPMGNPLPSLMRPGRKGGYTTMRELCTDISALVDVVWLSGTPVLQIPYLLALADFVPSYLPSFPASPRAMFTLLVKLDAALSSMLRSRSLAAAVLRGMSELYTKRDRMTQTDVVRLQSIVSRSRVAVTRLVSSIGGQAEDSDGDEETAGDDTEEDFMAQEDGQWDMQTARVYEQTILAMGDKFGGEVIT